MLYEHLPIQKYSKISSFQQTTFLNRFFSQAVHVREVQQESVDLRRRLVVGHHPRLQHLGQGDGHHQRHLHPGRRVETGSENRRNSHWIHRGRILGGQSRKNVYNLLNNCYLNLQLQLSRIFNNRNKNKICIGY